MVLNFSSVYFLDKNKTKHTISTMFRYKKGEGITTVWNSGGYDKNATPAEYFTFTLLEDDTYSIKAATFNLPTDVVLPSTYKGKAVTVIANSAFLGQKNPTSIYIPDSVISIEDMAFNTCTNLEKIYIPESVISIDTSVFTATENVTFYCEATSQPSSWSRHWNSENCPVVWGYVETTDNSYFTFTELEDGTYSIKAKDVNNLPDKIGIPSSYNGKAVTAIDTYAFEHASIKRVVIPEGVSKIGDCSFDGCNSLIDAILPSTLTEIGGAAFRDCPALTSIVIPASVTTVGAWAFLRDTSLTINCEASSQPSGWHEWWNQGNCPVVWGYTVG